MKRLDTTDMSQEFFEEIDSNSVNPTSDDGKEFGSSSILSKLQGVLAKNGITPKYQLVRTEGFAYEPVFTYRVLIDNESVTTGTGRSKKEAKNMAFCNLLEHLVGENSSLANVPESVTDSSSESTGTVLENPIGTLQEKCMSMRWPPPTYTMEESQGLPHERIFTMSCKILSMSQVGFGKSKKLAKRDAAQKMFDHITGTQPVEIPEDEDSIDVDSQLKRKCDKRPNKLYESHKNLKGATGPRLLELRNTSFLKNKTTDYLELLEGISKEMLFQITFVDIEEKSTEQKFQCLLQLSTQPVAVCYGSDITLEGARRAAIIDALYYLKLMT